MNEESPRHRADLAADFAPGSRLGGYRLEEQIGSGGMAVVFRAHDERLDRLVALKIMTPAMGSDDMFRQRFIRESRAAAAVEDPHIIPVYEAGEAGQVLFIAMRLVRGGDVRSLLRREGPLPPDRVASIISPVASALDAAHAAGLVHRDVKPANILLDRRPGRPDHVYLSDFGLSKSAEVSLGLTAAGQFLGTPDYTAPEQIEGLPVDGRTDQYALACAVFELLTGQAPFHRSESFAAIWAHLNKPPPSLAERRPGLPPAVDRVIAQALAKAQVARYETCWEFADALRDALGLPPYHLSSSSDPGLARPESRPGREVTGPAPGQEAPRGAALSPAPVASPGQRAPDKAAGVPVPPPGEDTEASEVYAARSPGLNRHTGQPRADSQPSTPDDQATDPGLQVIPAPPDDAQENESSDLGPQTSPPAGQAGDLAGTAAGAPAQAEQPAAAAEQAAGPAADQPSDPAADQPAAPSADEPAAPLADQPAAAHGNEAAAAQAAPADRRAAAAEQPAAAPADQPAPAQGKEAAAVRAAPADRPAPARGKEAAPADQAAAHGREAAAVQAAPPPAAKAAPALGPAAPPWAPAPAPDPRPPRTPGQAAAFGRRTGTPAGKAATPAGPTADAPREQAPVAPRRPAPPQNWPGSPRSQPSTSRKRPGTPPRPPGAPPKAPGAPPRGLAAPGRLADAPRRARQPRQRRAAYLALIGAGILVAAGVGVVLTMVMSAHLVPSNGRRLNPPAYYSRTFGPPQAGSLSSLAFSPNGKTLSAGAAGGQKTGLSPGPADGITYLWNTHSGDQLQTYSPGGGAEAFSPDGTMLAAAGGPKNTSTYLWQVQPKRKIAVLSDQGVGVAAVAFSANGKKLAVNDTQGTVHVWTVPPAPGAVPAAVSSGTVSSDAITFSPTGQTLAMGGSDGQVYLWNAGTGNTATVPIPGTSPITAVAFSPDGGYLAAGNQDGVTCLWDLATHRSIALPDPDSAGVNGVAFSPDGKWLAAGDANGNTYLWHLPGGKLGKTLANPNSSGSGGGSADPDTEVLSVAFDPDGTSLATTDTNGHAYLWKVSR